MDATKLVKHLLAMVDEDKKFLTNPNISSWDRMTVKNRVETIKRLLSDIAIGKFDEEKTICDSCKGVGGWPFCAKCGLEA